jgi:hypothetical protein
MLGDNMSVVLNTTVPSSQLKKKHNAIAYHRVREAIAANIVRFAHIRSECNFADILTKPLPNLGFNRIYVHSLGRTPEVRTYISIADVQPVTVNPDDADIIT